MNCKIILPSEFVLMMIANDKSLIDKYNKYVKIEKIRRDPNKRMCPQAGCKGFAKRLFGKFVICYKWHRFCFICSRPWHIRKDCCINNKEYEKYQKEKNLKQCPCCKNVIDKIDGCNHISCNYCKYQWCWLCNEIFTSNHYMQGKCTQYGGNMSKNQNDESNKEQIENKYTLCCNSCSTCFTSLYYYRAKWFSVLITLSSPLIFVVIPFLNVFLFVLVTIVIILVFLLVTLSWFISLVVIIGIVFIIFSVISGLSLILMTLLFGIVCFIFAIFCCFIYISLVWICCCIEENGCDCCLKFYNKAKEFPQTIYKKSWEFYSKYVSQLWDLIKEWFKKVSDFAKNLNTKSGELSNQLYQKLLEICCNYYPYCWNIFIECFGECWNFCSVQYSDFQSLFSCCN